MCMKRFCLLVLLIFQLSEGFAQDIPMKQDSLKRDVPSELRFQGIDSLKSENFSLKLPRLNPVTDLQPQFTPHNRFILNIPYHTTNSSLPPIQWCGVASDFITSKSRTAIAATMPVPNLLLHSSATLGLVETPWFGKGNYYILNAGANYAVSSLFNVGIRGGYNSNFGTLPFWNVGFDAAYMLHPNMSIDGGLRYVHTAQNAFMLNQSALLLDLHTRYRLNDNWYLNAYGGMPVHQNNNQPQGPMLPMMNTPYYGGTVEHWFNSTTGVEAGLIWMRDMFTGKMRAQPKLELLFRPGK